jgi:hypothetical protein
MTSHDKNGETPLVYRDILSIALGAQSKGTPIVDALLASEGKHNQSWLRIHQARHIEIAFHEVEHRNAKLEHELTELEQKYNNLTKEKPWVRKQT